MSGKGVSLLHIAAANGLLEAVEEILRLDPSSIDQRGRLGERALLYQPLTTLS
jgi:hypothetical protein